MAKWVTKSTTAVTTAVRSNVLDVSQMTNLVAQVSGITTGTLTVQVSEDGTNWVAVGSALTANGRPDTAIPRCRYMSILPTVATTIAAVLTVSGERVPTQSGAFGTR